jgi:hypothetical protein
MKNERPMATGAMKVDLFFSTATMRDGEDEHGGHEHLNEETLDSRRTAAKGSSSKEGTGGEAIGKSSAL